MQKSQLLRTIHKTLIVSCQALPHEPLHGSDTMVKMAVAAKQGGCSAIRANTPQDVAAIKAATGMPVFSLYKVEYPDSDIYITPTMREVDALVAVGADVLAFDLTCRKRPNGQTREAFMQAVKTKYPCQILMADISTYEEGVAAEKLGVDMVSTTLSGYTSYSPDMEEPDAALVERLAATLHIPVLAEGRITEPQQVANLLELGAWAAIVGAAITRPQEITKRFVQALPASAG